MKWMHRAALCTFVLVAAAGQATAGLLVDSNSDIGGFVPNSAAFNPGFLAVIGTPDEFISFSVDKFGNPAPIGFIDGSMFSNNVVFSSGVSQLGFGGVVSNNVLANGDGIASEIGPGNAFNGVLIIDFLAAGRTATVVGLGPVEFLERYQFRVYDQFNALIGVFDGVSDNLFTFAGAAGTDGTTIGRVEMDGAFFAIQDIQFDLAPQEIPEPTSIALFGLGGLGLLAARRRRQAV